LGTEGSGTAFKDDGEEGQDGGCVEEEGLSVGDVGGVCYVVACGNMSRHGGLVVLRLWFCSEERRLNYEPFQSRGASHVKQSEK